MRVIASQFLDKVNFSLAYMTLIVRETRHCVGEVGPPERLHVSSAGGWQAGRGLVEAQFHVICSHLHGSGWPR